LIVKLLVAVTLIVCLTAEAFPQRKKHKVFVLKSKSIASYNLAVEGFRDYSHRKWNIIEYDLAGDLKNSQKMLEGLNSENPDVVLAVGTKALACVNQLKVSRPVVFCMVMNLPSYDFSGQNVTGVTLAVSSSKKFEVLTEFDPKIKSVGVLLREQSSTTLLAGATEAASKYGLKLIPLQIGSEKQIPPKIRSALGKVDALCMLDDSYIRSEESLKYVVLKSLENDIPFMAISKVFVKEDALVSLSPSFFGNGRQAAGVVEKVLENRMNPKDIPVSCHEKPDLIINLRIAQKIHLDIPPALLEKAKHVFE